MKTLQQATEVTGVAKLIPLVMEIVTESFCQTNDESIIDQALVASTNSSRNHGRDMDCSLEMQHGNTPEMGLLIRKKY